MRLYTPAHHLKLDAPTEQQALLAHLLAEWRWRKTVGFPARDPLDFADRASAVVILHRKRLVARAWLNDTRARARERLRASLRVVRGGRS